MARSFFDQHREAGSRHGRRMVMFGGVGFANTATDFAVFVALVATGVSPAMSNLAGFVAANAQSYVLNSRITFRHKGLAAPLSFPGYAKFAAAHSVSLLVSTVMIVALSDAIGPVAAKASALVVTFVWNYSTSALLVFRSREEIDR